MPAIDQCEPAIVEALSSAGWQILDRPFPVRVDKGKSRYLYADLRLERRSDSASIIVVEVKCFIESRAFWDDFYQAIGQYIVYQTALHMNQINTPLYLAVPHSSYKEMSVKPVALAVLKQNQIKLIAVDIAARKIEQWIP